ncbi:MAG TPA: hypothetical protein VFF69_12710, partial [Phycisphaerales bacterium]|nr:hypothetical protein [Phycisphaerales bacterium]
RSGLFVGPLSRDERAAHGYNTILCIPTGPGSESPIVLLDGDAFEVGRDDLDLTVPSDVSGAPLGTMRFRLIKAVLDDLLPEHPGRELAVALVPVGDASAPNTISVIRMYDLDLQPVAEMWTRGSIDSLVWDAASRQVLIGLSDAVRLQTWHPDLVAYDAMWCVDSARLAAVIAIPPEEVRGMLIANSPGVPVASPSWVIVRAPDDLAAPTSDDLVRWMTIREPISSIPGAVCLIEAEIGPGRSPGAAPGGPRAMAWAHLGSDGRLLEPFACDDPTRAAAAPRVLGRFIRLDLGLLAQMEPLAQQWAKAAVDWEEGRRLIGGHAPMTAEESEAAESLARAMTTNWRWLNNASCAITEHPDRGWRAGDYERALHWAERGVQIHDSRCPNPAECDSSWVIRNTLGLARYRTGSYSEALASFAACERAWTRTRDPEVDPDTLNIALQAMCLQRLGRRAEAAAELERARQSFTRCVSYRDLAEAAVREAEAVVGG